MTYTAITAKRIRTEAGSLAKKLAAEFELIQNSCNHQAATVIVAASDSLHPGRADYVCDGVDDQVQIQAAIDALPSGVGGLLMLTEGSFSISSPIIPRSLLHLQGQGIYSTTLNLADNANCNMIEHPGAGGYRAFVEIDGIYANGNHANNTDGWFIHGGAATHFFQDCYIHNVFPRHFKDGGIHFYNGWGNRVYNSVIEDCQGIGIQIGAGGRGCLISNNKIMTNAGSAIKYESACIINGNELQGSSSSSAITCSSSRGIISNNHFIGIANLDGFVRVFGHENVISNNVFDATIAADWGVHVDTGRYGNAIRGNIFIGTYNWGHPIIFASPSKTSNIAYNQHSDIFMDVLAVSTTHVRSNEDLSAATPITYTLTGQPDVPRTLSWSFDTHAQITEYDMEVIGVDAKGNTVTETWDETAGWSGESSNAFAIITSIKMTSRTGTGAGDTMDIGITDVLGLSNVIYATSDVFKIKKNNANVAAAAAQVNTTYDTYDMAVIGLAATDDFTIWYKSNLNIIS